MGKEVRFAGEARQGLWEGIQSLTKVIAPTLGPRGRNVALWRQYGSLSELGHFITSQGSTLVREIEALAARPGPASLGVGLVREAGVRTGEATGDGVATAIVLVGSIIYQGLKAIAAGANPMFLKKGIDRASQVAVEEVRAMARPVTSRQELVWISASAANDDQIGELVAQAALKVGPHGLLVADFNEAGTENIIEYSRGLDYPGRYLSYHLDTTVEDPYILLCDRDIARATELLPLMERLGQIGHKRLVVIAPEVEGNALGALVVNREKGDFRCAAVRAPKFGRERQEMLEDLAIFTGGVVITGDSGQRLEEVLVSDLGRADRVVATEQRIFVIGGHGDPARIQARIEDLKRRKDLVVDEDERLLAQERLALLSGGIAFIKAGGFTRLEQKERKGRIEDALNAFYAVSRGGIVPGGGVAYLNAAASLPSIPAGGDERLGIEIVSRALETPLRQMAENAGFNGSVVVENIRRRQKEEDQRYLGFDLVGERYGDLFELGIIDPTEVVVASLMNAASCASTVLTVEAVVTGAADGSGRGPGR